MSDDFKPVFLAITRYKSYPDNEWRYIPKVYATLESALDGLNWTQNGTYIAANVTDEEGMVGLWRLDSESMARLDSEAVEKVERRITEHRSRRITWTVAAD